MGSEEVANSLDITSCFCWASVPSAIFNFSYRIKIFRASSYGIARRKFVGTLFEIDVVEN